MKKIRLLLWILMLCVPLVVSCGPKDGKAEPSATEATVATTEAAITGRPKSTGEATSPEAPETTEKPSVETESVTLPEQTTQKEAIELPII